MGVSFNTVTMDTVNEKEVKEKFKEIWEEARDYYGSNPYSGSFATLQKDVDFKRITFASYNEAQNYICEHQEKWGRAMAVIVKEGNNTPYTLLGGWCAE